MMKSARMSSGSSGGMSKDIFVEFIIALEAM